MTPFFIERRFARSVICSNKFTYNTLKQFNIPTKVGTKFLLDKRFLREWSNFFEVAGSYSILPYSCEAAFRTKGFA